MGKKTKFIVKETFANENLSDMKDNFIDKFINIIVRSEVSQNQ